MNSSRRQRHQLSKALPWAVGDQETVETGGWGGHLAPEVVIMVMMAVVMMMLWWWWWMWLNFASVDIGHCHQWLYHPHKCHSQHHPLATHLGSLALAWGQERLEYSALLLKFGSAERHMKPTFEGCSVSTKTKKTKDNNDKLQNGLS